MKILKIAIACTVFCSANSFAEPVPVPASKAAYIGTWKGKDMSLTIAPSGEIAYKRVYGAEKKVDLNIELAHFHGNDFDAGFGFFHSTFVVSKPPLKSGGKTKMIVDGIELTKED
jgi:hypothetical protein